MTSWRTAIRLRSAIAWRCSAPPAQFCSRASGCGSFEAQTVEEDVAIDLAANYEASYLSVFTHFLDRLDDGEAFETSPEDNLETLRIVEQVYAVAGGLQAAGLAAG